MTFERLSGEWKGQLHSLWKTVFGDEDEYIDLFFENYFDKTEAMGAVENGKLLSMLFLLPMTAKIGDKSYDARYIYAVATHPEHRGKELSTHLLEATHAYLKEQGVCLSVLVPASESLFDYYSKRGYKTEFYLDIINWNNRSENQSIILKERSLAKLKPLRDRFFSSCGMYCEYDEDGLCYRDKETRYLNGEVLGFTVDDKDGYAVCLPTDDYVLIKELAFDADERVFNAIASFFKKDKLVVRLPGNQIPFAMSYWYDNKPEVSLDHNYISLVLD